MTTCATGCTHRGLHQDGCTCTDECTTHELNSKNHCTGCLPRAAVIGEFCQRCADRFRDALEQIPTLVQRVATEGLTRGEHQDRRSTTNTVPTASPHWDTADEITMWASAWAYALSRWLGSRDPIPCNIAGIPTADITTSCTYLTNHLTQALEADFATDLWNETRQHRGTLVAMLGGRPPAGTPEERLITLTEAVTVTGATRRTIQRWIANGKFARRATMHDTALYLEADVRAAAGETRCDMTDLFTRDCDHCRRTAA
jgi:predicted DNA-binding transcriptional regulator AlpA